ncbi:hypothetical protein D3C79_712470 [compost metagenome]
MNHHGAAVVNHPLISVQCNSRSSTGTGQANLYNNRRFALIHATAQIIASLKTATR